MQRDCFLCEEKVALLFSNQWILPGLNTTEIGISICPSCGSVCQSPTVTADDMMTYYDSIAVYTNPGRQGKPSATKVRDLDEQIQFVKRAIGYLPQNALQIGSSDGYTLSRFRDAGVHRVLGVEPSTNSVKLAKKLYNVESVHSGIEDFQSNESFELIIMTHVLEHFFEPQKALTKCRHLQSSSKESFLFVEVPLMAQPESLFPGFFSFEHINYYTRKNLSQSLANAGYYPISVLEHYKSNMSPIIGILASTKKQHHLPAEDAEYEKNKKIVTTYRREEIDYWQQRLNAIKEPLSAAGHIYLWGAGIHSSQLIANTDLLEQYQIDGLTDGSSLKHGLRQGDFFCVEPHKIPWQTGDALIISSYASEKEIYDALGWLRDLGVITLRLHNIDDPKSH